ncbi:MAG: HAD-superfamily hydrolase [Paenibacillus sp.]|jgi:HAD superfamily hydrolase (TIGR01450 family)|nr:HAD-superfamily hydrolase [Paenibacillus sp.]
MNGKDVQDTQAFLFDLDGCVYYGGQLASGAKEVMELLRAKGKRIGAVTNNSTKNAKEIASSLTRMGIAIQPEHIFCPTDYAGRVIFGQYGTCLMKIAGSDSLRDALQSAGHEVIPLQDSRVPEVIVIGRDIDFDYDKLYRLTADLDRGAKLFCTNMDMSHPGENGTKVPETGALVASFEAMSGQKAIAIGKPAPYLFRCALEALHVTAKGSVMLGDNLDTDIAGAAQSGLRSVWVRGGQPLSRLDAAQDKPDWTVDTLDELRLLMTSLD